MPKEIKKDTEITEEEIETKETTPEPTVEPTPEPEPKPKDSNTDTTNNPAPVVPAPDTKEVDALHKQLAEALEFKEKYESSKQYKEKYEETQESLKGHEEALKAIAQDRISELPEEFQDLVPEGSTQSQLEWLRKADQKGLFKTKEPKSIGGSSRTNDPNTREHKVEDMTTMQKLTSGIKDFYTN